MSETPTPPRPEEGAGQPGCDVAISVLAGMTDEALLTAIDTATQTLTKDGAWDDVACGKWGVLLDEKERRGLDAADF